MKKLLFYFVSSCFILSCASNVEQKPDCTEVEELKIKLDATEAQLLNVRAELSKCKGIDSTTNSQ